MELKGADARKMMLVIGIMFLHSLGEGAGVGVSFAGPQGVPQGLVVTLAIAVHNIPEGMAVCMVLTSRGVKAHHAMLWSIFTSLPQPLVAVPAFICAQSFQKFLPLCMGFAAGCMIWMVLAEVIPDSFKEASHSQVASAATLSSMYGDFKCLCSESGPCFRFRVISYNKFIYSFWIRPHRRRPSSSRPIEDDSVASFTSHWNRIWNCICTCVLATSAILTYWRPRPARSGSPSTCWNCCICSGVEISSGHSYGRG